MMEYKSMLHTQRAYFQTGDTKDVEFRIRQLKKLYQWITVHEQEIMDALYTVSYTHLGHDRLVSAALDGKPMEL